MENLNEKISKGIKESMLQKNPSRLRALRGIKSQLDILNSSGKVIGESDQLLVLQKMMKQRKESAEIYKTNNRLDLYEVEASEILVIEEFLPKQLTKEELKSEIGKIVAKHFAFTNATNTASQMGKIIGIATKELVGKADGKSISEAVKSILQEQ